MGAGRGSGRLFIPMLAATVVLTAGLAVALLYELRLDGATPGSVAVSALQSGAGEGGAGGASVSPGLPGASIASPGARGATAQGAAGSGVLPTTGVSGGPPRVSPTNNTAVSAGQPVLIGGIVTQSGPLDASDVVRGMQAWTQHVNSQGGIGGHRIELEVKDDGGNPAVGRAELQQIVQEDHAVAVVSECAPVTDQYIVQDITQDQVPMISDCDTTDAGYRSPYFWSNFLSNEAWQTLAARYIFKHRDSVHIHRPYLLCLDQSSTLPFCNAFQQEWTHLGGTTCAHGSCNGGYDSFELGTTRAQFEATALQIKQSGADAIVSMLEPTNELAFLQALRDQGMDAGTWPQYAPIGVDANVELAMGSFAYGIYLATSSLYFPGETSIPGVALMHQVYAEYFGDLPADDYVQVGWVGCTSFGEALRRSGTTVSRQSLLQALATMSGFDDGMQLPLTWTATQHGPPAFIRFGAIADQGLRVRLLSGWVDQNGDDTG